jgi:predicted NUDIX family phosphoesterase
MFKEKVLVVNRAAFPKEWLTNKITKNIDFNDINIILDNIQWIDRNTAETDSTFKQIIPYILVYYDNKLVVYQRKDYTEKRLLNLYSIGVGGHIAPEDYASNDKLSEIIIKSANREISEEFEFIDTENGLKFCGFVNDETTDIGQCHFGIIFSLVTKIHPEAANELHNMKIEIPEIIKHKYNLELWSHFILSDNNLKCVTVR